MEPKSVSTAVSSVLSIASGTGAPDAGGGTEVDFAKVISAKQGSAGKHSDQQQGKKPSADAAGNDDARIMSDDPLALKLFKPKIDAKALEVAAVVDANAALLPGVPGQDDAALSENVLETDAMVTGLDAVLAASGEETVVAGVKTVALDASALLDGVVTPMPVVGEEGDNEVASGIAKNVHASGDQSKAGQDVSFQTAALLTTDTDPDLGADDLALQSSLTSAGADAEIAGAAATLRMQQAALSNSAGNSSTDGTVKAVTGEVVPIAQDLDPNGVDAGAKAVAASAIAGQVPEGTPTQDETTPKLDKNVVAAQGSSEETKPQTGAADALAKSGLTGSDDTSDMTVKKAEASPEMTKPQAAGDISKLGVEARATTAVSSDDVKTPAAESKTDKVIEPASVDAKMVESTDKGAALASAKLVNANSAKAKLADVQPTDAKPVETKIAENTGVKSSNIQDTESKETSVRSQQSEKVVVSDTPQKAVTKETEIASGKNDTNLGTEKPLVNGKRELTTAQQKLAVAAETAEVVAAVRSASKAAVTPVSAAQTVVIKQSTETAAQIAPVQTEITKQMRRKMESVASDKKAATESLNGKLKDVTVEQIPQKPVQTLERVARNIALESVTPVASDDDKAASETMAPVNAGSGKPQANLAVSSNTTTPAQNLAGLERWSNSIVDVQKQGWTQSLVRRVAAMPTNGGRLVITLQPASLGRISVSMTEGRRGIDIRMRTETSATAALLNDAESRISQLLQSSGMQLNSFSADTSGSFADNENNSDGSDSRDQANGQKSANAVQELPENAEQSIAQQGDGLVNLIA